jgi:hypothetical protein
MSVTIDSDVYKMTFHGILNAQGEFWTPLAFESERAARDHIRFFWRNDPAALAKAIRQFKIVPVRIQLTALASVDRSAERHARNGHGPKDESAVPQGDAR